MVVIHDPADALEVGEHAVLVNRSPNEVFGIESDAPVTLVQIGAVLVFTVLSQFPE